MGRRGRAGGHRAPDPRPARLRLPPLEPRAPARSSRGPRSPSPRRPRRGQGDARGDARRRRKAAQPSGIKTFGSTFKNPDDPRAENRTAGQLLDAAGCRGLRIGGAGFSAKHANFVENHGDATTADVVAVMAEGRRRVRSGSASSSSRRSRRSEPVAFPADWSARMIVARGRRAAPGDGCALGRGGGARGCSAERGVWLARFPARRRRAGHGDRRVAARRRPDPLGRSASRPRAT